MAFEKKYDADIVVVGGGVSGVVSAIAAARNGCKTILVHDRSVLGGNASSEVRVHIGGTTEHGYHFDARESGIIEEIRLETAVRDPYNTSSWIDTCLYTKCIEEPNLQILLNTYIDHVKIEELISGSDYDKKITKVEGSTAGSEMKVSITGKFFLDGTGHGTLGSLAGAEYRYGQESREEFNESLAPENPTENVLGASILFKAEDLGRGPVDFSPPSWAEEFTPEKLSKAGKSIGGKNSNHGKYWHSDTSGWWWVELGGNPKEYNPIKDNEKIRHELQAICYGIWDYIKNKHPNQKIRKEAENFDITWIGYVPGHRESRRLVGDYMLTQEDVVSSKLFKDRVACGGWSIDLHPGDFWCPAKSAEHTYMEVPYSIPYRCLYSKNVENLFMVSRCISVSHVAHGSTRLIATLALCGQASGTAAALAIRENLTPREIYNKKLEELQQNLIKDDSMLLGVENKDDKDLAKMAKISASSEFPCTFGNPHKFVPLYFPLAERFWLSDNLSAIGDYERAESPKFYAYLKNSKEEMVTLSGGLRKDQSRLYFSEKEDIIEFTAVIQPKSKGWVELTPKNLNETLTLESGNYWIYLNPSDLHDVEWGLNYYHYPGTRIGFFYEEDQSWKVLRQGKRAFYDNIIGPRGTLCIKIENAPSPYPAKAIVNGKHRPFKGPNLWISKPFREDYIPPFIRNAGKFDKKNKILSIEEAMERSRTPQYGVELPIEELDIELYSPEEIIFEFERPIKFSEIWFTFDTDLDNCFPHQNYGFMKIKDWPIIGKAPTCVSELNVYVRTAENEKKLVGTIQNNFQRRFKLKIKENTITDCVYIEPTKNWGFHAFNLYEIRIYK